MALDKIKIENYIIEVHNNWRGVQTVTVNRQIVSKKFSFAGTDHFFTLLEGGHDIPYVLTTKINSKSHLLTDNQILIDLKRDGKMIKEDVLLNFITVQKKEKNKSKAVGIKCLRDVELISVGLRRRNFGFSRVKKIKHSRATVHFFEEESIQKNKSKPDNYYFYVP